jgi:succinyl-CoA synthetase alpha subunit
MLFSAASQVMIQGCLEPLGQTTIQAMQAYGTRVVAGVAPGYGGQRLANVLLYDLVEQAVQAQGPIDATVICSHPYAVLDAALEAIAAGIQQIVIVTQGVPPLDMVQLTQQAAVTGTLILGANSPGLIVPGEILLGLHPALFYRPGNVALLSRNGPLTYEIAQTMTQAGIGQSIAISIGSDAIVGSTFSQWLQFFEADPRTVAIVLVGEIGTDAEELAAQYIAQYVSKPVVAYIAGRMAPRHRQLGHAVAILESQSVHLGPGLNSPDLQSADLTAFDLGSVASKIKALKQAGVKIADRPTDVPKLLKQLTSGTSRKSA